MSEIESRRVLRHRPSRTAWLPAVAASLLLIGLALSRTLLFESSHGPYDGVVVDSQTTPESGTAEAYRAGMQPGDVLRSWSRGAAHGTIDTPFDLAEVDIEQRPLGRVTLYGSRNWWKVRWDMGLVEWDVAVMPRLAGDDAAVYQQAVHFSQNHGETRAAQMMEDLSKRMPASSPPWLRAWLLSRAGKWWALGGDRDRSNTSFQRAIQAAPAAGAKTVAQLWTMWGDALLNRSDYVHAAKSYREAIAMLDRVPSAGFDSVRLIGSLAYTDSYLGDEVAAEQHHRQALALAAKLAPGGIEEAGALIDLGASRANRGALEDAEDYYRRGLRIQQKLIPGSFVVAGTFLNLGSAAGTRGNLVEAEEHYLKARAIFANGRPGNTGIGAATQGLAEVFLLRGDWDQAERYHRESLTIWRKEYGEESLDVAAGLVNLGEVAWHRGDFRAAEEYYRQSLAIQEKRQSVPSLDIAVNYDNLAKVVRLRGNLTLAEELFSKAMAIRELQAPGSLCLAASYDNVAGILRDGGDLAQAESFDGRALAIQQHLNPKGIEAADSLYSLALIEVRRGRVAQASALFERALASIERQPRLLGGADEARSAFGARYRNFYGDYIDALLAANQPGLAFGILERSRARALLSMLAERDLLFTRDLPADLRRARKVNATAYDQTQDAIANLLPVRDAVQIAGLNARLDDLATERDRIAAQVKRLSPRFAALHYPQPLDLQDARRALDPGTVLLAYAVRDSRSYLFIVKPAGEEPAVTVRALAIGDAELRSRVSELRSLIAQQDTKTLKVRARELYSLLVKPAETEIGSATSLLIAPDGPLHVLPFSALIREQRYFVEWKPIHTVLSATLYAELKRRSQREDGQLQLAAFGDPRYPSANRVPPERSIERGLSLAPLPFSRGEVNGIAALFPRGAKTYFDSDATEDNARSAGSRSRIVHFAVHGFVDERLPLNSGLAFTIPEHWNHGEQNGLLQAWEIFDQVRFDVDLMVLSACETGLGKERAGEGLIGLTRAFQYAGARSILASLWKVDDLQTGELMIRFYSGLKAGRKKDEALRDAQLQLLGRPASSHPYYWAAFSMIGPR